MEFKTVEIKKKDKVETWDVLKIGNKEFRLSRRIKNRVKEQLEENPYAKIDCMFVKERNLILDKSTSDKLLIVPANTEIYPSYELIAEDNDYKLVLVGNECLVKIDKKFVLFTYQDIDNYEVIFEKDMPLNERAFYIIYRMWKMNGRYKYKNKEKWCKFYGIDVIDDDICIWRYSYKDIVVFDNAELIKVYGSGDVDYIVVKGDKKYLMIRGQHYTESLKDGFKGTVITFHSDRVQLHPDFEDKEKIKSMDWDDLLVVAEIPDFDIKITMKRWEYLGKSFYFENDWYDEPYQSGYSDYTESTEARLIEEKEFALKDILKKCETCKEIMG
ncbi:MAG: hypothetical protein JHC31_00170 [Sulfurihydrogenibium sp.]|nr:hypothetical protein [Sulfurihydrogenibium sp.]